MKKNQQALQFNITLRDVRPAVWRRILISPDATFWDLHVAIQDAMGWDDSHLHDFAFHGNGKEKHFGMPSPDGEDDDRILPGWEHRVSDHVSLKSPKMKYWYDFGDDWMHDVVLEKIVDVPAGQKLPSCIGGKQACPPDDCGGPWGYAGLLEALADKKHEEHDDMIEWMGGDDFDPNQFAPSEVTFSDPKRRLRNLKAAIG